jgi:hypothetical protein
MHAAPGAEVVQDRGQDERFRERERDTREPDAPMQISPVGRDPDGLGHEQRRPGGEQRAVHLHERRHRQRLKERPERYVGAKPSTAVVASASAKPASKRGAGRTAAPW